MTADMLMSLPACVSHLTVGSVTLLVSMRGYSEVTLQLNDTDCCTAQSKVCLELYYEEWCYYVGNDVYYC